jgi:hypothetical protein
MRVKSFWLFFFSLGQVPGFAQPGPVITTDVQKVQFVYDDIHRFNEAFNKFPGSKDSIALLNETYFSKASDGLKVFIRQYGLSDSGLLRAIQKYPDTYVATRNVVNNIEADKEYYLGVLRKYQSIFPNAVFPPFYFLIGERLGINSGSAIGVLFEVEAWENGEQLLYSSVLAHELTHFQQRTHIGHEKYIAIYGEEKTLLALTIREGVAEFFANLVTGRYTQEKARRYVEQNEKAIWDRFQKDKMNKETGEWMFVQPKDKEQPRDVGYILGARIVQYYYDRATDKQKALKHILNITDYNLFLDQSKYAEKFDRKPGQ